MEIITEDEESKKKPAISYTIKKNTIIVLIALLLIFLVTRSFWLWFWKINIIEQELEMMREELRAMTLLLESINAK